MTKRPPEIRNGKVNENKDLNGIPTIKIENRKTPRLLKLDGVYCCGRLSCEEVELFDMGDGVFECGHCYEKYKVGG